MTPRPRRLLAAVLVAALAVAACSDEPTGGTGGTGATTTADDTARAAGPGVSDPGADAGDDAEAVADASDDAEADAEAEAGAVVATVFGSDVPFEDKVAVIEGGEAHRVDHEAYVAAARAVGGIAVEPAEVTVDGGTATVTYDVLYAGNVAYADLTTDVTRAGDAWVVPTTSFCSFLASARVPCTPPAG